MLKPDSLRLTRGKKFAALPTQHGRTASVAPLAKLSAILSMVVEDCCTPTFDVGGRIYGKFQFRETTMGSADTEVRSLWPPAHGIVPTESPTPTHLLVAAGSQQPSRVGA